MRKLLVTVAVVLCCACPCKKLPTNVREICTPLPTCPDNAQPTPSSAVVIQAASTNAGYGLPSSIQLPAPVAKDNSILVAVRAGSHTGHVLTISDSLGHVYHKVAQFEGGKDAMSLGVFVARVTLAGTVTVTVSDSTSPGATRWAAVEVKNLGVERGNNIFQEGDPSVFAGSPATAPGDFLFAVVSTAADTVFTPGVGGTMLADEGKFFVECGARSVTLSPPVTWAVLSTPFMSGQAALGECATPTPMFQWDKNPETDIRSYAVYVAKAGGTPQLQVDIKPEVIDGVSFWRGVDAPIPIQRYTNLEPLQLYEISIKAFDNDGHSSDQFSQPVIWCAPELCGPGYAGPCH